ncbi:bifunctional peptidase and (3S)-lysyl hydroxylase Jmjd7-like [Gigantopelta aegis]|uniref:bifunctional peptidase and (3S)-lysyl hydroxylase Jmjd7-like n=1 Tax=Gigantopelta aegis TaxID=1735272 RepID=UPI001B88DB87|nr:bifunctional peptidase and (3S)-lysyl hydroxylase Jmjd7-like [Gigantopelta aegis]
MPTEKVYHGQVTIENLVNFLNNNCHMYRNSDGSLTVQGMHHEYILQNLFRVENVSDLNMARLIKIQIEDEESKLAKKDLTYKEQIGSSETCKPDEVSKLKSKSKMLFQHETHLPIPQCEKIPLPSRSEFFNEFLSLSKPVIIQGAMSDWAAFKKWTNKFLRKKFGNRTVHVKLTPGGEYEGVEKTSLWENFKAFKIPPSVFRQLHFPDLVVVRPATQNVKFSEFMDIVESVSTGKLRNVSAYLEYTSVDQYMPELKKDLKEMPFFTDLLELKHLNMWLSDGNTLGKTHFDPFDNFLCQISGQKQVILYSPHDGEKMYEGHIPEAILSVNRHNYTFRRKTLLDSTSMVMSPVDIVSPDLQKFPRFADARPSELHNKRRRGLWLTLHANAFWWHEVQSRP